MNGEQLPAAERRKNLLDQDRRNTRGLILLQNNDTREQYERRELARCNQSRCTKIIQSAVRILS